MSTIYNDLDNDFTLIPNIILQDTRVSGLAFKMYSYIAFRLGRDKKWEFYNREIISHFKEGRDAVMKARNELLELGYLEVIKQNKAFNGKYLGNDYIIRKNPKKPITEIQYTENQYTENPLTENQCSNNKDRKKKDPNKKDCNAVQGNFSKNEEEILENPSASSRNISARSNNSTSSEIPNNSTSAKTAQVQNPEISLADFKTEWYKITSAEPKQGFQKSYDNFLKFCSKMTAAKKAHYKDWQEYLKERWVGQEIGLIRSKTQNEEGLLPVQNIIPIEPIKDNQKFWDKFAEISETNEGLKKYRPHLNLIGIREKVLVFEISKEKKRNFEQVYNNQFTGAIKQAFKKVYDIKITDYELQETNI
jgi:hypothetical protein